MKRLLPVFASFAIASMLAAVPEAVSAQGNVAESTDQAESAIEQATEQTVENPEEASPADPEEESPFVEAAKEPGVSLDDLSLLLVPLTRDELADLAGVWQKNVQAAVEQGVTLNLTMRDMSEADAEKAREELVELTEQRGGLRDNYAAVLEAWKGKGAAEEDLAPHLAYQAALSAEIVKTTDARSLVKLAQQWLTSMDGGLGWLVKALVLLLSIWLLRFPAMFLRHWVRLAMDKLPDVSELLKRFVLTVVYWATIGVGVIMVLAAFGLPIAPILTIFGGLSFVLAFAMQDTLGNLASGLMIMILKPFDVGHQVEIAGVSGIIDDMNIVSTHIRTFDNQYIIVPNSKIWGDVITNVNVAKTRRIDMVFGVGYEADLEKAKNILMELATGHEKVLEDPEPQVYISALGDSAVMINCRPWGLTEDYWTIYWDILERAKYRFDEAGISIPYPQQDIHVITAPKEPSEPRTQPDFSDTPSAPAGDEGNAESR